MLTLLSFSAHRLLFSLLPESFSTLSISPLFPHFPRLSPKFLPACLFSDPVFRWILFLFLYPGMDSVVPWSWARSVDKGTWLIPRKLWARRRITMRGSRISLKSSWDLMTSSEYELRLNRQYNYLNWSKLIQQSGTDYDLSFLTSLVRISEPKLHDVFMKMSWSLSVMRKWLLWRKIE